MGAKLEKLYAEYCGTEKYDLDKFNDELRDLPGNEITCKVDAIKYIEMVKSIREENEKAFARTGKNFPELLKKILGVGEDGVYFNPTRYLLELLQNVDDCDYKDNNPSVDIFFDNRANRIVYKYNEDGFTPRNVHDITGIAEDSKNNSYDRDYIGEKGIGFKSVFGVVDKVRIQSGWFSFEIYEKKFTIPEPAYNDFQGYVPGTTLTLFMKRDKNVGQIFAELKKKYSVKNSIFAENLVLFLNKLQSVRFYDYDSSLLFKIEKFGKIKTNDKQLDCKKVKIYVAQKGGDKIVYEKEIGGYQFTEKIHFTRDEYECRYGKDTKNCSAEGRDLPFMVIIPDEDNLVDMKGASGCLYSYLPTQIKLNVPVAIHSPFKLNVSREDVDSQDENVWFKKCVAAQRALLEKAYSEIAYKVRESIMYLLPTTKELFKPNVEHNFSYFGINRDVIMSLPIFYTENGFKTCAAICVLDKDIDNPQEAFILSGVSGNLFCCPEDLDPAVYGLKPIEDIYKKILVNSFNDPKITEKALDYLEPICNNIFKKEDFCVSGSMDSVQLKAFLTHKNIFANMQAYAVDCLKNKKRPEFSVHPEQQRVRDIHIIRDFDDSLTPGAELASYFKYTGMTCYLVDFSESFYLPTKNYLCISAKYRLDSYLRFTLAVEPLNDFAAKTIMVDAMRKIDDYVNNNSISDDEYMALIVQAQRNVIRIIGERRYEKYMQSLIGSGISPTRCIKELLQNADDCIYSPTQIPSISIEANGNVFKISYNENGFTRKDLKAITSLAESTKEENASAIGYKGVGFKSIFCVAKAVEIHSGSFHFRLTRKEPTVPDVIPPIQMSAGTVIIFETEDSGAAREVFSNLSIQNIVGMVLCLRKLRRFDILGSRIEIEDEVDKRYVILNGQTKHIFLRHTDMFIAPDDVLTSSYHKKEQQISCYYQYVGNSEGKGGDERIKSYVYCGLPTEIETYNDIFLDADFELTTSRDDLAEKSKWNEFMLKKAVEAMAEFLKVLSRYIRSGVLDLLGMKYSINTREADIKLFSGTSTHIETYWLDKLRTTDFLPTFDDNKFMAPNDCVRYPAVGNYLLRYKKVKFKTPSSIILDGPVANMEFIYNKLGIHMQAPKIVLDEICGPTTSFISEKSFRDVLYPYLKEIGTKESDNREVMERVRELTAIPIWNVNYDADTKYISYNEGPVYLLPDNLVSRAKDFDKFKILNVAILSSLDYQMIYGVVPKVLSDSILYEEYQEILKEMINSMRGDGEENKTQLYNFILEEYKNGNLELNNCLIIVLNLYRQNRLPLKNMAGNYIMGPLFRSYKDEGFFKGRVMNELSVSPECMELAEFLGCNLLSMISADAIDNHFSDEENFKLSSEDMEDILGDYFKKSSTVWSLIHDLYSYGLIDDELIEKYNLSDIIDRDRNGRMYTFPIDKVTSDTALEKHMNELYPTYGEIVSRDLVRSVRQVYRDNTYFDIDSDGIRAETIERYKPEYLIEGSRLIEDSGAERCFCQCCGIPKKFKYIEAVSIESKSNKYRPPMRMALCLECAKTYKGLRENSLWLGQFESKLMGTDYHEKESITIEVDDYKYRFTQMHLAEIQYILGHDKKDGKE